MTSRAILVASVVFASILLSAKDNGLPNEVAKARTVRIVIRQQDVKQLNDPTADAAAQQAVERALTTWGRFEVVEGESDLVIAVHAGTDKLVSPTIENDPTDTRGSVETADGKIRVFGQQGRAPVISDEPTVDPKHTTPHVGKQVGRLQDTMEVYTGGPGYRSDSTPIWRYAAKDALKAPNVTAVEQFRKAVAASEKKQKH